MYPNASNFLVNILSSSIYEAPLRPWFDIYQLKNIILGFSNLNFYYLSFSYFSQIKRWYSNKKKISEIVIINI